MTDTCMAATRAMVERGSGSARHAAARSSSAAASPARYVARLLGKRGATIVSPENFMLYTPILPEAASGTLEPRHVVVPLRMMCPHAELLLGRATRARRAPRTRHGRDRGRARSSRATRSSSSRSARSSRTLPIPGLAEHGLGFKDLADAIHLRNHVLRRLEAAAAAPDEARRGAS